MEALAGLAQGFQVILTPQLLGYCLLGSLIGTLIVVWFAFERRRFQGPPLTEDAVKARQAEIAAAEHAIGEN